MSEFFFLKVQNNKKREENERLVMQSTLVKNCVWPIEEIYRTLLPPTSGLEYENLIFSGSYFVTFHPSRLHVHVIHLTPSYLLHYEIKNYIHTMRSTLEIFNVIRSI